jgi:hypothetical protein
VPVSADDHVAADGEEMIKAEEALLQHPDFQKVIAELRIPENATVVADGWIYGRSIDSRTELGPVTEGFILSQAAIRKRSSLASSLSWSTCATPTPSTAITTHSLFR